MRLWTVFCLASALLGCQERDSARFESTTKPTASTSAPAQAGPTALSDVTQLSVGPMETCVVRKDDTLWCWSKDSWGSLNPKGPWDGLARPVPGVKGVRAVSLGASHASCVLDVTGTVRCRGGEMFERSAKTLRRIPGLDDVVELKVADGLACARKRDNTMWCWGAQLGVLDRPGDDEKRTTPVEVMDGVARLAIGDYRLCAFRLDGELVCLGNKPGAGRYAIGPIVELADVLRDHDPKDIVFAAGMWRTCVGLRSGVHCTFRDEEMGTVARLDGFDRVIALSRERGVTDGRAVTCGVAPQGTVRCHHADVTRDVKGISDAIDIGVRHNGGCALLRSGRVSCWDMKRLIGTVVAAVRSEP